MPGFYFDPSEDRRDGERGKRLELGRWVLAVKDITVKVGRSGYPYLNVVVVGVSPKVRGGKCFTVFSLQERAIWKLANLARAILLSEQGNLDDPAYLRRFTGKPFIGEIVQKGEYLDLGEVFPWEEGDPLRNEVMGWQPPEGTGEVVILDEARQWFRDQLAAQQQGQYRDEEPDDVYTDEPADPSEPSGDAGDYF